MSALAVEVVRRARTRWASSATAVRAVAIVVKAGDPVLARLLRLDGGRGGSRLSHDQLSSARRLPAMRTRSRSRGECSADELADDDAQQGQHRGAIATDTEDPDRRPTAGRTEPVAAQGVPEPASPGGRMTRKAAGVVHRPMLTVSASASPRRRSHSRAVGIVAIVRVWDGSGSDRRSDRASSAQAAATRSWAVAR